MTDKVQLKVSELLQDLQNGLTRDEIGVKYGLNKAQIKVVFRNPKLKFKKTIKPKDTAFVLEDDIPDLNQLSLDLTPAPADQEIHLTEPEAEVLQTPAEDAYTQAGVEVTDDTVSEQGVSEQTTPVAETRQGAW